MILHDFKLATPVYNLYVPENGENLESAFKTFDIFRHKRVKNSYAATLICLLERLLHKSLGVYEKNIDVALVPSQAMADMLKARLPNLPLRVLPNFIQANGQLDSAREAGDYLFYFGRLEQNKGIWLLLQAMQELGPAIELRIAGAGSEAQAIRQRLENEGLTNIKFLGRLGDVELSRAIAGCRLVVVPSICFEIQPFAVLESFVHGKPVVAAAVGGIPELVEDGVNGLLFEPGNARDLAEKIRSLYFDQNKLAQLGRHGRARVEVRHAPELYYQSLMSLILEFKNE